MSRHNCAWCGQSGSDLVRVPKPATGRYWVHRGGCLQQIIKRRDRIKTVSLIWGMGGGKTWLMVERWRQLHAY